MALEFLESEQTICALATPAGRSGVAIVRMSGKNSFSILSKLTPKFNKTPESHRVYLTKIYNLEGNDIIDEVLITFFKEGKSYTGEESVEISCHGNPVISNKIIQELIKAGARTAGRGEFTYRAFSNGKLDLVQAESVLSLIEANSNKSAQLSLRQLEGDLSHDIGVIEDKLVYLLANFEASIDFVEEDIEIVDYTASEKLATKLLKQVEKLLTSYKDGRIIKEGFQVALVGAPNVGKSSLLNALLKEDKAIVSNIPGTTRDVIEATIQMDGLNIHLFDTAGIRSTEDEVEKLGIQRSEQKIEQADLVLYLVDSTENIDSQIKNISIKNTNTNFAIILSKIDLMSSQKQDEVTELTRQLILKNIQRGNIEQDSDQNALLLCSSVSSEGLASLFDYLKSQVSEYLFDDSGVIQQSRHFELLSHVRDSLVRGIELINKKDSVDFISFELHDAIYKLHEVLGKKFDDEVMDRVFKEFCIGK